MEFHQHQAIYLQIAELVCEKIILGVWPPEEKIVSVRDLAVELEVNPNTVMRTYDYLQQMEIIFNKRGLGFFVSADGKEKSINHLRNHYREKNLPLLYKNMVLLNISMEEIERGFEQFKKQNQANV